MPDFTELTALFAASYELVPASTELVEAQADAEETIDRASVFADLSADMSVLIPRLLAAKSATDTALAAMKASR